MTDNGNRARDIIDRAIEMDMMDELPSILVDTLDLPGNEMTTDLHVLIWGSFSGDDDFDDLVHEINHELGDCNEDDEDCAWNPRFCD